MAMFLAWLVALWCGAWCFSPNPKKEWRACGRPKPSYVCDPEFILNIGDAEKLDQIAMEFQKSTSCVCSTCSDDVGISVGILVQSNVSDLLLSQHPVRKELAEIVRKKWSLSTCDSDILVVLLTQQNVSSLSMGLPVQSILSQEVSDRIFNDCWPHIQSGYYYQGLESILNSLNDVLVKLQKEAQQGQENNRNILIGLALGFAALLLLALGVFTVLHRQAKRRKSYCSTIYDPPQTTNRKPSLTRSQHLELLRKINEADVEDDENTDFLSHQPTFKLMQVQRGSSVKFNRQLSDVVEEDVPDEEMVKRSSVSSGRSRGNSVNVPVTEL